MDASSNHPSPEEDLMSTTLTRSTTSFPSFPSRRAPRPGVDGARVTGWRRAIERRRYAAAKAAHDREQVTDAYVDRHGTVELADSLVAFGQR